MRYFWLNTAAAVALAAGLAAADAQTSGPGTDRMEPGRQGQSGQMDKDKDQAPRAAPRQVGPGQGSGQSTQMKDSAQPTERGAKELTQTPEPSDKERAQKTDTQKSDTQKTDTQKTDTQKSDTQKADSQKADTQKSDTAKRDGARTGSGTAQKREEGSKIQRSDRRDGDDRARQSGRSSEQDRRADDRRDMRDRGEDRDMRARGEDRDGDMRARGQVRDRDTVRLSEREQVTLRQAFTRERNLHVVSRNEIDFSISIGATVPRSIRLEPLPPSIVRVVPQFRGYRYVVVEEEIVIIHPQTYRIVTVIPAEGRVQARTGSRSGSSARVSLSSQQRAKILSVARDDCTTVLTDPEFDIAVGSPIPQQIELCPFEEVVIRDVDVVRPFRFFVVRDQVVLVDPNNYTIVDVIR